MRTVYIAGAEKRITLAQYVQVVKRIKTLPPETEVKTTFNCWWPGTVADMRREFTESVHDRINQAIPYLTR